jgi:hypothetical protein
MFFSTTCLYTIPVENVIGRVYVYANNGPRQRARRPRHGTASRDDGRDEGHAWYHVRFVVVGTYTCAYVGSQRAAIQGFARAADKGHGAHAVYGSYKRAVLQHGSIGFMMSVDPGRGRCTDRNPPEADSKAG